MTYWGKVITLGGITLPQRTHNKLLWIFNLNIEAETVLHGSEDFLECRERIMAHTLALLLLVDLCIQDRKKKR